MELRTIIVEDEQRSREILKNFLEEFCSGIKIVGTASNVEEAVLEIKSNNPDVVFLDIELQGGTGFEVLSQVSNLDFEVIFTTAFDQYAVKAVKYSSLDYLMKPIDLDELQQVVERAKVKKNQSDYKKQLENLILNLRQEKSNLKKICLSTNEGFEFIAVEDILYCKGDGSYTMFFVEGCENLLVSKNLKEYENLLDQDFMRVHQSFLVNLKKVKKYVKSDGGYIVMDNGDIVSVSRSKKEDFIRVMSSLL